MQRLIIVIALALSTFSCEKNNKEDSLPKEMLNGKWQSLEENSFGCNQQLEISDTTLSEIKICAGIPAKFKAKNFSFNGKIIKYKLYGLHFEYQVSELTKDSMVLGYSEKIKYFRVN